MQAHHPSDDPIEHSLVRLRDLQLRAKQCSAERGVLVVAFLVLLKNHRRIDHILHVCSGLG